MLTRPIIPIWVLPGHRPRWQIKPTIGGTETGDEVQVVSEAAGFFVLDEVQIAKRYGCWQPVQRLALIYRSATGQRFRSLQKSGPGSRRTYAADLSYLPLMQELEKRYEANCAFRRWSVGKRQRGRSPDDTGIN